MSVVAACYIMHKKMLESLKAEGKLSTDAKVSNTHISETIKMYGIERFREEVKKKNYDIPKSLLMLEEKWKFYKVKKV